jgi:Uncharacterised protein family UPF0047
VTITKGKLDLGPWEHVFYGEFDGRRKKRALVKIMGDLTYIACANVGNQTLAMCSRLAQSQRSARNFGGDRREFVKSL